MCCSHSIIEQQQKKSYLLLRYLIVNQDDIMISVFICNAQVTYALLIFAAENLHEFVVLRTEALFEASRSSHQLVFLPHVQNVMQISMFFTERSHTLQTGLLCFTFPSGAHITLHI